MSDARIGYDSSYHISNGDSPETFEQIGEVFNITPGEESTDRVDVTHYKSPDRRREFIAGLIDPGEAPFEINWVPGNETDEFIRDLRTSGETRTHKIRFPNGVTVSFDAIILSYSKAIPLDDKMTATITVAVSGAETWGMES